MPIPRIYKPQECLLEGYEGLTVRLLVNPTGRELSDWQLGGLGLPGCTDCERLNTPKAARGKKAQPAPAPAKRQYCDTCATLRSRKARACVALYGPSLLDRPCTTEAEALTILDDDDIPTEVFVWLMLLPDQVVNARMEQLRPNSPGSVTTPST